MAISAQQCKIMLGEYEKTKALANSNKSLLKSSYNKTKNGLNGVDDSAMDTAKSAIDAASVTQYDPSSLNNDLSGAISSCPGLSSSIPKSLLNKVNLGLPTPDIPNSVLNGYKKGMDVKIGSELNTAMVSTPAAATGLSKMRAFNNVVGTSGVGTLMAKLKQMETCLDSACSLVSEGDKVHDSLLSEMNLDSNYGLDKDKLASDTGINVTKITDTLDSYEGKFGFSL